MTPVDGSGSHPLTPGEAYGPAEPVWSYSNGREFYSSIISGVGRLPNGNTLITSGVPGTIFEVTPEGETVWKYVNPIEGAGPLTQGDPIPTLTTEFNGKQVLRAYRYAPDNPCLAGRDLTPGGPAGTHPTGGAKLIVSSTVSNLQQNKAERRTLCKRPPEPRTVQLITRFVPP